MTYGSRSFKPSGTVNVNLRQIVLEHVGRWSGMMKHAGQIGLVLGIVLVAGGIGSSSTGVLMLGVIILAIGIWELRSSK